MEIRLHRIGMIADSVIALNGLTVITGENESGKTTIGKALYALVDSVSDLSKKAKADKDTYILNTLKELTDYSFFRALFRAIRYKESDVNRDYPALSTLSSRSVGDYRRDISDWEAFAHQTEDELNAFLDLLKADKETMASNKLLKQVLSYYVPYYDLETRRGVRSRIFTEQELRTNLSTQIEAAIKGLQYSFEKVNGDPLLTHYVKDSLNRTLREEFSNQIQPARDTKTLSTLSLCENDFPFLAIDIKKDHVDKAVYHDLPLKRVYFVDNPIVLDQNFNQLISVYRQSIPGEIELDSYLNPRRIKSHMVQLSAILRGDEELSPLEQRILDEKLTPVKEKINAVVPGTFDFSGSDEFYLPIDGERLRITNLAAGSKMFSIIKLLLEKGLLDESSVLILDEPEIHLHPQWQNQLAEVIVLLVKELHVNVLLTTHSSNFMLALDAYMRKYEIRDLANFYQAQRLNNGFVKHERVTDRLKVIYSDFVKPLAEMDILRDQYNDGSEDDEDDSDEGGDSET